jgi:hypothetical protein
MPTDHVARPWAFRSTLIAVADIDRSIAFYRELGPFDEIAREDAVALLGELSPSSIVLILRELRGVHHARHGQQSLGPRSIAFNVGSLGELDRIESVLRGRDLFTSRGQIANGVSELLLGRDPTTRLWRSFATQTTRRPGPTITERLPIWFIHRTPDAATEARSGGGRRPNGVSQLKRQVLKDRSHRRRAFAWSFR